MPLLAGRKEVDSLWFEAPLTRTCLCLPSPSRDLSPLGIPLSSIPGCSWAAGSLVSSLSEVEPSFQFHCNTAGCDTSPYRLSESGPNLPPKIQLREDVTIDGPGPFCYTDQHRRIMVKTD